MSNMVLSFELYTNSLVQFTTDNIRAVKRAFVENKHQIGMLKILKINCFDNEKLTPYAYKKRKFNVYNAIVKMKTIVNL